MRGRFDFCPVPSSNPLYHFRIFFLNCLVTLIQTLNLNCYYISSWILDINIRHGYGYRKRKGYLVQYLEIALLQVIKVKIGYPVPVQYPVSSLPDP